MLGIDVSKATLTGTLVQARDRRPEWEMTVPNTVAGVAPAECAAPHRSVRGWSSRRVSTAGWSWRRALPPGDRC